MRPSKMAPIGKSHRPAACFGPDTQILPRMCASAAHDGNSICGVCSPLLSCCSSPVSSLPNAGDSKTRVRRSAGTGSPSTRSYRAWRREWIQTSRGVTAREWAERAEPPHLSDGSRRTGVIELPWVEFGPVRRSRLVRSLNVRVPRRLPSSHSLMPIPFRHILDVRKQQRRSGSEHDRPRSWRRAGRNVFQQG